MNYNNQDNFGETIKVAMVLGTPIAVLKSR